MNLTLRSKKMLKVLKALSAYDIAQLNSVGCAGDLVLRLITTLDEELKKPVLLHGLTPDEFQLCQTGHKINAIRAVRERTSMGLADSKQFVEEALDKMALGDIPNVL